MCSMFTPNLKRNDTCHDPYNVLSKFGEDPLRNVETYGRTDTHTQTYTQRARTRARGE
jgi:hypothetical protein